MNQVSSIERLPKYDYYSVRAPPTACWSSSECDGWNFIDSSPTAQTLWLRGCQASRTISLVVLDHFGAWPDAFEIRSCMSRRPVKA